MLARSEADERAWLLSLVSAEGDGCWDWPMSVTTRRYGQVSWRGKQWLAHRLSYLLLVGPLDSGKTIDHLCRNRQCFNPDHLRQVSNRENVLCGEGHSARNAQKTHCPHGHPLSGTNVYVYGNKRTCKTCTMDRQRKYRTERRAA